MSFELNKSCFGFLGAGSLYLQIDRIFLSQLDVRPKSFFLFDDTFARLKSNYFPLASYRESRFRELSYVVAIGYHHLKFRLQLIQDLLAEGLHLPTLIHPSAYIHPSCKIGPGAIIFPNCCVGPQVEIGAGTILHCNVTLAHDIQIGRASYLSPSVSVSGNVGVGESVFLGTGSCVANGLTIGSEARIGIGSVITKSLPQKTVGLGNPFRKTDFQLDSGARFSPAASFKSSIIDNKDFSLHSDPD